MEEPISSVYLARVAGHRNSTRVFLESQAVLLLLGRQGIGDAIALSATPAYLVKVGLLDKVPQDSDTLNYLMKLALDKVAFLPFGLFVDEWRWKVFSGEITPANHNKAWWDLKLKYQGVTPPSPRSETDFDPGAKFAKMLEMGASQPWPDELAALSGERTMDASAILDYFAPLKKWLDEENKGQVCGW
jgi:peptidyl-dipeptidase A